MLICINIAPVTIPKASDFKIILIIRNCVALSAERVGFLLAPTRSLGATHNESFVHSDSLAPFKSQMAINAERVGFEPTDPFRDQHLSRVLLSTTQPPLQYNSAVPRTKNCSFVSAGVSF